MIKTAKYTPHAKDPCHKKYDLKIDLRVKVPSTHLIHYFTTKSIQVLFGVDV
jgi:hypothetical protein